MTRLAVLLVGLILAGCATTTGRAASNDAGKPGALTKEQRAEAMSHYLASVIYERQGEIANAIEELRKAADIAAGSQELVVRLLGAYYVNEDYENAAAMAERAVAADPNSVILNIWLGRVYYQLERYDEATVAFERAIELDPSNALAYEALAEIEEETNDLVGAIEVYEKMIELAPDSAFLHYRLGLNLLEINDDAGARTHLERAVELNPDLAPAHYMLGLVYADQDMYDPAIREFETFLNENPEHVQSKVNLAAMYARKGNFNEAIERLTAIIESADVEAEHHLLRTVVYLRRGEPVKPTLAAAPNDAPLLGTVLQALVRRMAGEPYRPILENLDDAEGDLDTESIRFLNRIITLLGDETGSFLAEQFASLVDAGVRSRVVEVLQGRSLMSLERPAEAVEVLEGVVDRYGGDKWVHYYLATAYDELEESAETESNLRAALEYDANDPDLLNFLGYFLAEEDRKLDEAEALLERALQIDPENGFYLDSLGWVYYRQGKADRAVEYIRRAIRLMNSDDAVLRDHLGDAYLLQGDEAAAVEEWQRALRLDPEIEGVREKIEKHQRRAGG